MVWLERSKPERLFAGHRLKAKTCYAQIVAARALLVSGHWEEAKEKSEASILSTRELELPWLKQQAHELLGDILQAAGETAPAYDQFVRAVAVIEQIRSGIRVDEFRSAFFKDKLRVYEKLIGICLNEGGKEKDAEAFYYLESQKARTLVDLLLNELELVPVNDTSADTDWQTRWQQLRQELHWFYSKVHQQEVSEKGQPNGDLNLLDEIRVRERALVEVARLVQMQSPGFFWLRNVSGMLVEEVRGALAPDETVIEYYFDGEHLKIFVVDHNQLEVVHTPFLRKELRELVLELKFQFEKFHYSQSYLETHRDSLLYSANAVLKDLHEALFEPVADLVVGQKLIFVPFDFLHNVPFQALFDGDSYIIDHHEVACAPSARLFALCARKPTRRLERALIIGAADIVAPQITQEIDAIRNLFEDSQCFTGAEVDEKVLAENSADCDVLHIASHAVFRQDNPMFSAFKLADNWFNFYDVCSLRLPAALVVLSGCSTGANKVYAGDEILGLVRGFLTAGAASMVVSLWAVNDPATAKLMTVFYEHIKSGLAPRKALREAALQTRHSYSHPYYWAPFILIGRS
jgi:CHAT domain-containing protein